MLKPPVLKAEQYMAMAVGLYQDEGLSKAEITSICNEYFEKFKRDQVNRKKYGTVKGRDPFYEVEGNVVRASFGGRRSF